VVDINKTTTTLEPEKPTRGGLCVSGKDRVVYVPQERKSRLGIVFICIFELGVYVFVLLFICFLCVMFYIFWVLNADAVRCLS